jgi:hypothetical protein
MFQRKAPCLGKKQGSGVLPGKVFRAMEKKRVLVDFAQ